MNNSMVLIFLNGLGFGCKIEVSEKSRPVLGHPHAFGF